MKGRGITPIVDLNRRAPEAGRIRMGEKVATKSGKGTRPAPTSTFRLTSPSRELMDDVARLYGGTVTEWNEKGRQWQCTTDRSELPVVLVPGGLTTMYELWAGGGRKRQCDGLMCTIRQRSGPDDYEMVDVSCLCTDEGFEQCKPTTRLQVLLPELPFAGTWRLESKGWNAAQELPGMYDTIVALAEGQFIQAVLGFHQRTTSIDVGDGSLKREFVVPYLRIAQTLPELLAGQASMGAITAAGTAAERPALASGAVSAPDSAPAPEIDAESPVPRAHEWDATADPVPVDDDGITDAEIVDDDSPLDDRIRSDGENFGLDPAKYLNALRIEFRGDETLMAECSASVRAGRLEPLSVVQGKIQWRRT